MSSRDWRRRMPERGLQAVEAEMKLSSARAGSVSWTAGQRVWSACSARKTMEVEILNEAHDVARVKNPSWRLPSWNGRKDGSQ